MCAVALIAAARDTGRLANTCERADRAYDGREWNSAAALYGLVLDMRPDSAAVYPRAIVASELAGDTAAAPALVEEAMARGIGFASLLQNVRATSFAAGAGDNYAAFLLRLRREMPWMSRPLDHELLNYYTFRRDGAHMVEYAGRMLAGLPDSREYLSLLAEGYLLDGHDDEAIAIWTRILSLEPDDYLTLLCLGNYYVIHGNPEAARRYLSRAQAIHPTPYVARTLSTL